MNSFFQLLPKKTRILIIFLLVVIVILFLIRFSQRDQDTTQSPLPIILFSPQPSSQTTIREKNNISALQKTQIGETVLADFKLRNVIVRQEQVDGGMKYILSSDLDSRPHEVIFKDNKAMFERTILLTDNTNFKYPKAQELIQRFGQPGKAVRGSKFYGYNVSTYIYADQGFAFIAEEGTGNVFEVQTFPRVSLDQYMQTYGQDIQEGLPNAGEPL